MALITYDDKVALNENPNVPNINKVNASDMNQIKNAINNLIWPVGSYYETSDASFDPNVTWGGTWVLEEDGTVLVSQSSATGSIFNDTLGTTVGEEKHTLTVLELPSNVIQTATTGSNADGYIMRGGYTATGTYNIGGSGNAHNIVQPSKIVNRWHRTS